MDREWKLGINHKIYVPLKTSTTLLTFFNSSSFFDLKKNVSLDSNVPVIL